jgi:hypothetical protein
MQWRPRVKQLVGPTQFRQVAPAMSGQSQSQEDAMAFVRTASEEFVKMEEEGSQAFGEEGLQPFGGERSKAFVRKASQEFGGEPLTGIGWPELVPRKKWKTGLIGASGALDGGDGVQDGGHDGGAVGSGEEFLRLARERSAHGDVTPSVLDDECAVSEGTIDTFGGEAVDPDGCDFVSASPRAPAVVPAVFYEGPVHPNLAPTPTRLQMARVSVAMEAALPKKCTSCKATSQEFIALRLIST